MPTTSRAEQNLCKFSGRNLNENQISFLGGGGSDFGYAVLAGIASAKGFPPKFFMEGVPVSGSGDCYADMAPGDTYKIPDDYCTYWTGVNFSLILTEEDDDEVIDIPVVKIIPTVKPPPKGD